MTDSQFNQLLFLPPVLLISYGMAGLIVDAVRAWREKREDRCKEHK